MAEDGAGHEGEPHAGGAARGDRHGGHCLCGAVRFHALVPTASAHVCHCAMCRSWSGGLSISVDVEDLVFADGSPLTVYQSSGWGERLFCATCGSSIAWRMKDGSYVNVAAFAFDPPLHAPVSHEIFIDEKPATYAMAGETRKMTGPEVVAQFVKGAG